MKPVYVILAVGFSVIFIASYALLSGIDGEKAPPTYIEKTVVVPAVPKAALQQTQ